MNVQFDRIVDNTCEDIDSFSKLINLSLKFLNKKNIASHAKNLADINVL